MYLQWNECGGIPYPEIKNEPNYDEMIEFLEDLKTLEEIREKESEENCQGKKEDPDMPF